MGFYILNLTKEDYHNASVIIEADNLDLAKDKSKELISKIKVHGEDILWDYEGGKVSCDEVKEA